MLVRTATSLSSRGYMMNTLIVLLGIIAAAVAAVPAHFPRGKAVVYKYNADMKAGALQPADSASQFGIECRLKVKHSNDPTLRNAYLVAMTDVKHGLYNGRVMHFDPVSSVSPIPDAAKDIQNPFMIVYDENARLQGIKVKDNESTWSVNIKKAIASAMQLDLVNIQMTSPMVPHSFISKENTIHGSCQVAYNVHPKYEEDTAQNVFMVTKMHEPENCTHFVHLKHSHVETEKCHLPEENGTTSVSKRDFEIENQGNAILIKKLIAHGSIHYIPFQSHSEGHYIMSNQTFILEDVVPDSNVQLSSDNLNEASIIHNFTYSEPKSEYVPGADIDVTHGRHVVNPDQIVPKVKKTLDEAADYLKENQIKEKQADWKYGQTINRIMHLMSFLNLQSFEQIFGEFQDATDSKQITMKNIFLGTVPNVGTTASCLFVRNVIRRNMISAQKAITMLAVLPMHVKHPSQDLLLQMEPLLRLSDSLEAKKAGILCFATLIHKTFKHEEGEVKNALVNKWLDDFMDHIEDEQSQEMKTVYMMAMKNVCLKDILKRLEPIVKGEVQIGQGHQIRLQAIFAVKKVIAYLPERAHNLLWPVLANVKLPVELRIVAYDVLMHHFPYTARFMNMYWFMVQEKNEHLYNYHMSTIKGIANSVDPCLMPVREMAKKILKFTRTRHVPGPLSTKLHFDYVDEKFGYGEAWKTSLILNTLTGLPEIGSFEQFSIFGRRPTNKWGIHWHVGGLSEIIRELKKNVLGQAVDVITNENVKKMLSEASTTVPVNNNIDICMLLTLNNNVVTTFHADKADWKKMLDELKNWKNLVNKHLDNFNWEQVTYDTHFEMHVPTDLGMPTVLFTKMPWIDSLKIHAVLSEQSSAVNLKLQMKYIGWKHGEHAMSLYNPIADVWHSVRKTAALDFVLPIDMSVSYYPETNSVKVTLPRLPTTEFSIAGMLTSAKSFVTVTDDETNALKNSCPECHQYEVITNNVDKKTYKNIMDSQDTGLQYTMVVYHCENNLTPVPPISEWREVFWNKNTMNMMVQTMMMQTIMATRQLMTNNMINSQGATCSNLIKVEPSIVYPTSAVDLTGKISVQNFETDKMHVLNSQRIDVRGTMDAKPASNNERIRWDANLNIRMNQGHVNNTMKVVITRSGRPEKSALKICFDGQTDYPVIDSDILKIDSFKKEVYTKMKLSMGQTKDDKCAHDDMDLTIFVKGEQSEEQRKQLQNDKLNGSCVKHISNPLLNPEGTYVPKTWECVHEAILHSTLRKYLVEITSKKAQLPAILHLLQDMHSIVSLRQLDSRNLNLVLEFPVLSDFLNVALITPDQEQHHLTQLPWGHPVWNGLMDNTHFSTPALYRYLNNQMKMCTILPKVLLTFDNGTILSDASDKWTLLVGNHIEKSFAVTTKLVRNSKMDVKIFVGEHEMEIANTDSGIVVTVDQKVVDHERGVMVPENQPESFVMKLTNNYKHLIVQSQRVPLMVAHTPTSVTVFLGAYLQGQIVGRCGSMNGTYHSMLPPLHTATQL
ncbi:larval-specific very high density lipoprotein [Osmia lignaria lignaria]|uniref:larval-specific very high density lipoprotein n=1 Tax=Osmia lignaria lignaria TaxID=1437193 RepID=UPI00402BB74D